LGEQGPIGLSSPSEWFQRKSLGDAGLEVSSMEGGIASKSTGRRAIKAGRDDLRDWSYIFCCTRVFIFNKRSQNIIVKERKGD